MRLKGYISLEAAYVFAFMALLVIMIIELDFYLHDSLVNDTAKILGGMRNNEAETFYYDKNIDAINVDAIICSSVVGKDTKFINNNNPWIRLKVKNYYDQNKFDKRSKLTEIGIEEVVSLCDNAKLLRSSDSVVKLFNSKE